MRAFTPWPGTYTFWGGKQLKILAGAVSDGKLAPGQVGAHSGQIAIGTGGGLFLPLRVQLEGRKAVSVDEFMRGYPQFVGETLG
jgi:methionyl-tRNA formyltransferase